jgi:hypothetical protein
MCFRRASAPIQPIGCWSIHRIEVHLPWRMARETTFLAGFPMASWGICILTMCVMEAGGKSRETPWYSGIDHGFLLIVPFSALFDQSTVFIPKSELSLFLGYPSELILSQQRRPFPWPFPPRCGCGASGAWCEVGAVGATTAAPVGRTIIWGC